MRRLLNQTSGRRIRALHRQLRSYDHCCRLAPAVLRPELVPGVEVVKVLPTVNNPTVLELEDDRVANVQVLAVSVRGAALDADHVIVVVCTYVLQLRPEGAPRLLRQLAEVGQGRLAALVVLGERAPPRQVPHSALVEELGERLDVARVEGLVSAPHDRDVFICSHRLPPTSGYQYRYVLGVVLAAELRRLGPTFVPGFLKDRRDLGVGDEVLPALGIP